MALSTARNDPSGVLRLAVANLLRLAASDIKDAELLAAGRNPENALLLIHRGLCRLLKAVIATEKGWPLKDKGFGLAKITDANALKLDLAGIAKVARPPIHPKITRDEGLHADIEFNPYRASSVEQLVTAWLPLTLTMNNLNRSMGERDLYPFVLSNAIVRKLEFIHGIIADARSGHLKA
jgi:hypothetical protein